MDRDNRWERVEWAYNCLSGRGSGVPDFDSARAAVLDYYEHPRSASQKGDEFITPRTVGGAAESRIGRNDTVIFYNYRGDRPREIIRAFVQEPFFGHVPPSPDGGGRGFDRGPCLDLCFVTMTSYEESLSELVDVAFPRAPRMESIGGAYLAEHEDSHSSAARRPRSSRT